MSNCGDSSRIGSEEPEVSGFTRFTDQEFTGLQIRVELNLMILIPRDLIRSIHV